MTTESAGGRFGDAARERRKILPDGDGTTIPIRHGTPARSRMAATGGRSAWQRRRHRCGGGGMAALNS
jgi:hypothetical protein